MSLLQPSGKRLARHARTLVTLSAASLWLLSFNATGQTEDEVGAGLRWFEIEVLVFKQDAQSHADDEYFPLQVRPIPLTRYYDLISPLRQQSFSHVATSLLRPCNGPEDEVDAQRLRPQLEQDPLCIEESEQALMDSWYHPSPAQVDLGPREVTEPVVDGPGGNMLTTRQPFKLPASAHDMNTLRQRLERQGDKTTLLHTTWRQPVFNRNQGRKIRLFGGENFSRDYDYLGFAREHHEHQFEPLSEHNQIQLADNPLDKIEALLEVIEAGGQPFSRPDTQTLGLPEAPAQYPPNLPVDVWEFDGLMHIYLIGNFLHIDGEFNLREEVDVPLQATSLDAQADAALRQEEAVVPFLRAYYFNQLRRVISHETHYFDHPKFGVIVQIRRTDLSSRR